MPEKETITTRPNSSRGTTKHQAGHKNIKRLIVILLIILGLGGSIFFGLQYRDERDKASRLADPKAAAQDELQTLQAKLAKYAILPDDETPTLATVSDPQKLKGQTFFMNAKTGDKLLIYSKAKRAVLYRPSADKVVELAPVSIGEATDTKSSNQANPETLLPPTTKTP